MTASAYLLGTDALGVLAARGKDAQAAAPRTRTDEAAGLSAVAYLESLVGTPYLWGGKNPETGLDCSGAVVLAYEKVGLAEPGARYRHGSKDLQRILAPAAPEDVKPGDLAFYGPGGKVNHVMMIAGKDRVIGAQGGGKKTKSKEVAKQQGAYVKYMPTHYRPDLVSFGRAPSAPLTGSTSTKVETSDTREERTDTLLTVGIGAGVLAAIVLVILRALR